MAAAGKAEADALKAEHSDEYDALLSEQKKEEIDTGMRKRRRGPGFAQDEGDGGAVKGAKTKKAPKTAAASKNAAAYANAAAAAAAAAAVAGVARGAASSAEAIEEQTIKSASGRASAADKVKNLDKEMQTVARQHLQTSGSSTKALENLTVHFFLDDSGKDRYGHSSKLRGATCHKQKYRLKLFKLYCKR